MLQRFYDIFPEQRQADLYITGESYAGKYVPAFAYHIYEHNQGVEAEIAAKEMESPREIGHGISTTNNTVGNSLIPLKGIAIGDGLTDPISQIKYHAPQALALGLISTRQSRTMRTLAETVVSCIRQGRYIDAGIVRGALFEFYDNVTGGINYYDVRKGDVRNDWSDLDVFLNLEDVQRALNVLGAHRNPHRDTDTDTHPPPPLFSKDPSVYAHLIPDIMKSTAHLFPTLLDDAKLKT
ncbi:hypothetical protein HK102_012804, partial [Quaeritorhiza haematococci]